jgi:hypothetical protein
VYAALDVRKSLARVDRSPSRPRCSTTLWKTSLGSLEVIRDEKASSLCSRDDGVDTVIPSRSLEVGEVGSNLGDTSSQDGEMGDEPECGGVRGEDEPSSARETGMA